MIELDKLASQTNMRYQKLTYIRWAQYYSYGQEGKARESNQRVFPNGPPDNDETVKVEDGIYDTKHYIRKHNLIIEYLGDEDTWKNT